jgi:hypothetical protein
MLAVLCTLGRHICAPLGSAQLQIVWRLIGWAMLLSVIRAHPPGIDPGIIAAPYHAITAAGLLLLILGARLALLIAAAAAWTWLQIYILRGHDSHYDFVADEHLLFALVPALAALAWIFAALEHRHADPATRADAVTRAQLWQLRLCTLATLAFSALHKLNSDFLAAKTSCATLLAGRLAATWGLPDAPVGPLAIVVAEALVPVLLLLYPRLGALCLLALVTGLGHAGPYAFNALLAALALAFLAPASTADWRRYAARSLARAAARRPPRRRSRLPHVHRRTRLLALRPVRARPSCSSSGSSSAPGPSPARGGDPRSRPAPGSPAASPSAACASSPRSPSP